MEGGNLDLRVTASWGLTTRYRLNYLRGGGGGGGTWDLDAEDLFSKITIGALHIMIKLIFNYSFMVSFAACPIPEYPLL